MANEIVLREALDSSGVSLKNRFRAKIIAANVWGSSAYYPAEVLERDGARIFTAGLHMYQNHLSESEQWDRPEGSVENLVGTLESNALYEEDGEDGPGLYADVSFYPSYVQRITEIQKDVGLSVRAHGLTEDAEMDGRFGPVLVALLSADSVDVVTKAGAGGKLTSVLENDRGPAGVPLEESMKGTQSMTDITKADFEAFATELREAIAGLSTAVTEALKPVAVVEEEPIVEADKPAEIDAAVIAEALIVNNLPKNSAKSLVESIKAGKTLDEAVKEQTDLRDAFTATALTESGTIVINDGGTKATGLVRSVAKLNK